MATVLANPQLAELAALYEDAELRMLAIIAKRLKAGTEAPDWAVSKLYELEMVKLEMRKDLAKWAPSAATRVKNLIKTAYAGGEAEALATLVKHKLPVATAPIVENKAMTKLLKETVESVMGTHSAVLRSVDDAYRSVVREASSGMLLGSDTRADAVQQALNKFADKGITGFVDKAGRKWEMRAYVEMAVGTATHRAYTQGHLDKLQASGHDLVVVSDHKGECDQCRRWEGQVLSITGAANIENQSPPQEDLKTEPELTPVQKFNPRTGLEAAEQEELVALKKQLWSLDSIGGYDEVLSKRRDDLLRKGRENLAEQDHGGFKEWNMAQYRAVAERYDDRKPKVVRDYEDRDYQDINRGLRYGDPSDKVLRQVKAMDAQMSKHKFEAPTVLYRGRRGTIEDLGAPGDYMVEPGYSSASALRNTAEGFSSDYSWMTEIRVPEGSRYIPGKLAEQEAILPRNSRFRIVSVDTEAKYVVYELEES